MDEKDFITRPEFEARMSQMQSEVNSMNAKLDKLTEAVNKIKLDAWKFLGTFLLSSMTTAFIEWFVTHH